MDSEPQVTICSPSNRTHELSHASLTSGLNFSILRSNIEFLISDNSNDVRKENYWAERSESTLKYRKSVSADAFSNWSDVLSRANGELVQFLADDDYIFPIGQKNKKTVSNQISGYHPMQGSWIQSRGMVGLKSMGIQGSTAVDRVKSYMKQANGSNASIYSCFRKDLWFKIHELNKNHPLLSVGYFDWAMTFGLCAAGNIIPDFSTLYVYDAHQWSATGSDFELNLYKMFEKSSIGGSLSQYWLFFLGIDSFLYINNLASDVNLTDRVQAAFLVFVHYLNSFSTFFNQHRESFPRSSVPKIEHLLLQREGKGILISCLRLLESIDLGLASDYEGFYRFALEYEWGNYE